MVKTNFLSPRDQEIIANAVSYSACVGGRRTVCGPDLAEVKAEAERVGGQRNRGAVVYAIGLTCDTEASAAYAVWKPLAGWVEFRAPDPELMRGAL